MILVDSSVWIDHLRDVSTPQSDRLVGILMHQPVLVGDLILAEVLQGCVSDRDFRATLQEMTVMQTVTIGGREIAVEAAKNYRFLRARGITVRKTIDTLIATWCIEHDHQLLASDRDFDPFFEHLGLQPA